MFARIKLAIQHKLTHKVRHLLRDRSGNIALSFAIISVPLLIAVGASFDYARALNLHREMQTNLDAALVAAVNKVGTKDDAAIKVVLANWLEAEASVKGSYTLDESSVVIDRANNTVTAEAKASVPTTLMRLAGWDSMPVSVQASVITGATPGSGSEISSKSAFSMYFVLDRSGSMDELTKSTYDTTCYKNNNKKNPYPCTKTYKKIESLILAANSLLTQLNTADPDKKYVRVGAVSYDTNVQAATPLAWGVGATQTYVSALKPGALTNSGPAVKKAYDSLMAASENTAHKNMNGNEKPDKYIVFMTDGENTVSNSDQLTKQYCDKARVAKIHVYSIAFMAPAAGQNLLRYCATSGADYFRAEDTAQLVSAFQQIANEASKSLVRLTN